MKRVLPLITIFFSLFLSCEKDDICTTPNANTPYLIIRFYDDAENNLVKEVPNLLIQGIDNNLSYGIESTRDSIAIPLRILENNTSYSLTKDFSIDDNDTPDDSSDDIISGNPDNIIISYENESVYVSEACGYKNQYNNTAFGFAADTDNWILNTAVITSQIDHENHAHIHIFH